MSKKRTDNGLKLDFSLQTVEERQAYAASLVDDWSNAGLTLRDEDLELLGTYILYGKDADGKSAVQRKEIAGESETYNPKAPLSLEAAMESPSFNESQIRQIGYQTPYITPKPNLKREAVAAKGLESQFKQLWSSIDEVDERLRRHKSGEEPLSLKNYYKLRHLLVELRREQYTLKDCYEPQLLLHSPHSIYRGGEQDNALFGVADDYTVLPLGTYSPFNRFFTSPTDPSLPDLDPQEKPYSFDFRQESHIYELVGLYDELRTQAAGDPESAIGLLCDTLDYYAAQANLTSSQQYILEAKKAHQSNETSAARLHVLEGAQYSPSYISTIYTHQICPKIAAQAHQHYEKYKRRKTPNQYKVCNTCGELLPATPTFFVRQTRAYDGLTNRCKQCDKKDRAKHKIKAIKKEIKNV